MVRPDHSPDSLCLWWRHSFAIDSLLGREGRICSNNQACDSPLVSGVHWLTGRLRLVFPRQNRKNPRCADNQSFHQDPRPLKRRKHEAWRRGEIHAARASGECSSAISGFQVGRTKMDPGWHSFGYLRRKSIALRCLEAAFQLFFQQLRLDHSSCVEGRRQSNDIQ